MARVITKPAQEAAKSPLEIASALASAPAEETAETGKQIKKRKPFGQHLQKLAYPVQPGFHLHWFNDDPPHRINDAKEAGYEHVKENGQNVSRPVGVARTGGVLTAYLMKIPQEWYEEDMAAQQAIVDEKDRAIREGALERAPNDGRYIPSRGIKIRDNTSARG